METLESLRYGDLDRAEIQAIVPKGLKTILDVGCNRGAFGAGLKKRESLCVWGIEPDPGAAALAETRIDKVVVGYFPSAEIPANYFDAVVFNDVLEHVVDPAAMLDAAKAVLLPNGIVIASIPNVRHIENLVHILQKKDFEYESVGVRDRTHLRFFTKISIERLFADNGFDVVSIQGIAESWWSPSILRRLAFRIFPKYFEDTKYMQFTVLAKPSLSARVASKSV